jgi:cytochrome P450 family 9
MGLFLYLIPVALYLIYKWATAKFDFFEKQGIPFIKPLPLVGSNSELFFKKQSFVKSFMDNYNKYKSGK